MALRLFVNGKIAPIAAYNLLFRPLDSTRYFEFEYLWKFSTRAGKGAKHLDVSSPRLFPLLLVDSGYASIGELVNPDGADLQITRELARAAGLDGRCGFHECLIEEAPFSAETFDVVTCMSVLEHIPNDTGAIAKMWELVKRGGRLCVSLPCAPSSFEQYRDVDEYNLLERESDGSVFFQRFYDELALQERIFVVTGKPTTQVIYGEKKAGNFRANSKEKMGNANYAFWREPYMMGREYRFFASVATLPGEGVIAMEFLKR